MSQQFTFQPARKEQALLRLALFGPSGSGKTFTALTIAEGIVSVIGGKIAVIDTERKSSVKYADRWSFDALDLVERSVNDYVSAIRAAAGAGYSVLIIDSLTHGWWDLLDEVNKLAQSKYRGNTHAAWSEGTPKQKAMVNALLDFPGHVIATMRTKTEWLVQKDSSGRTSPVRVGLAPEQGKGIEYEFDMLMEISPDHIVHVIKDRSSRFQDKTLREPGAEFGKQIINWLMEGEGPVLKPSAEPKPKSEPDKDEPKEKKSDRPYPPQVVRDKLEGIIAKAPGVPGKITDSLRDYIVHVFGQLDVTEEQRNIVVGWSLGDGPKTPEEISNGQAQAILKWAMKPGASATGTLSEYWEEEVKAILEVANA